MKKTAIILIIFLVAPLYAGSHRDSPVLSLTRGVVEILNSKTRKDTVSKKKKKNEKKKTSRRGRNKKKKK